MIIGRYPNAMNAQLLAEIYTRLVTNHKGKKSTQFRLEAPALPCLRGDNRWQLDDANTFWIRINDVDKRYTLICYHDHDKNFLDGLKKQFEAQYLNKKK